MSQEEWQEVPSRRRVRRPGMCWTTCAQWEKDLKIHGLAKALDSEWSRNLQAKGYQFIGVYHSDDLSDLPADTVTHKVYNKYDQDYACFRPTADSPESANVQAE